MKRASVESNDSESTSDVEQPRRRTAGCFLGCLIFLPIAYFLSPLPAMLMLYQIEKLGFAEATEVLLSAMLVVYAPINWLIEHVPLVAKFYDWYMDLIAGFAP